MDKLSFFPLVWTKKFLTPGWEKIDPTHLYHISILANFYSLTFLCVLHHIVES